MTTETMTFPNSPEPDRVRAREVLRAARARLARRAGEIGGAPGEFLMMIRDAIEPLDVLEAMASYPDDLSEAGALLADWMEDEARANWHERTD